MPNDIVNLLQDLKGSVALLEFVFKLLCDRIDKISHTQDSISNQSRHFQLNS